MIDFTLLLAVFTAVSGLGWLLSLRREKRLERKLREARQETAAAHELASAAARVAFRLARQKDAA